MIDFRATDLGDGAFEVAAIRDGQVAALISRPRRGASWLVYVAGRKTGKLPSRAKAEQYVRAALAA